MQNERKVVELNLNDVLPNRFQPRIKFDENSIAELSESIKKYGVIQPIVVRKIGDKYEIIAGERRYKASTLAGKQTIPAIISEMSDKDSIEIALIENVQREDLTPIEKAISYKKILDMGYISQDALAQKVGKSQSSIANTLRLLNLSEEVQEALLETKISERHARSLLKIKDEQKQVEMLNRIINERLTVRKTDEEIDKMFNDGLNNNQNEDQLLNIKEEVVTIPDFESNDNQSNIPNFMDIDKIHAQAENIIKEEKPIADMGNLLQVESPTNPVVPPVEEEELRPGKFFSFGEEIEEKPEATMDFIAPTSFAPTQTDEMLSNLTFDPITPTFEVPQVESPVVEPVMPTFEAPQVETPVVEPVMPTFEVPQVETPTVEPVIPTFEAPQVETPTVEPVMPTYEVPQVETPVVEPVMPIYEVSEIKALEPEEKPVMPSFEALQQAISPSSFDFNSLNTDTNNQINTDFYQTAPVSTKNTDIKSVIEKVRSLGNQLEDLGYELDLEEIDFEDSYQVIIKISK